MALRRGLPFRKVDKEAVDAEHVALEVSLGTTRRAAPQRKRGALSGATRMTMWHDESARLRLCMQARLRAEGWHLLYHNAVDQVDAHPKPPPDLHSGRWQNRAAPAATAPSNSEHQVNVDLYDRAGPRFSTITTL
jgi:hypothetical protein